MKLYYAPGACSLSDHIALREVGASFEVERVDLKTKTTASGVDFHTVSRKGYVPVLVLDDGEMITENVAVLDWIAQQSPTLGLDGPLGRTRVLEALVFISTEIHGAFKPFWHGAAEEEKAKARAKLSVLFRILADRMQGAFLFGNHLSVADCYLFVTLRWAHRFDIVLPEKFVELKKRMEARPSVQAALEVEDRR